MDELFKTDKAHFHFSSPPTTPCKPLTYSYILCSWLIKIVAETQELAHGAIDTVKSQRESSRPHAMWNNVEWLLNVEVVFCEASCSQFDPMLPWHTFMKISKTKSTSLPLTLHSWPQMGLHRSMDWICTFSTTASHCIHKWKLSFVCDCPGLDFFLLKSLISHIKLCGLSHSLVRIFRS